MGAMMAKVKIKGSKGGFVAMYADTVLQKCHIR